MNVESKNVDSEPIIPRCACCTTDYRSSAGESDNVQPPGQREYVERWVTGMISTPSGNVPVVGTSLDFADRMGSWKARWGIGRMDYRVDPGLYAVGRPDAESPVLVTANYKLTFDTLRSRLGGLDAWILVLDTKGINVWCAAGKGTFGTLELIKRVSEVRLAGVVSGRKLILPQLGAAGISAHLVEKLCGFRVVYGPVRASDLTEFLERGMKATPEMRRIRFTFHDRAVLIPVEIVPALKYLAGIALALALLSGLGPGGYGVERIVHRGPVEGALFICGFLAGSAFTPLFLPWLPGRAFSLKGAWSGMVLMLVITACDVLTKAMIFENTLSTVAWMLIIPATASFAGMNFTGASTYTSLSGVKKEIRVAVPLQAAFATVGIILWIVACFV